MESKQNSTIGKSQEILRQYFSFRKQPLKLRRTVELNRNYALILGLAMFCFLVELPGDYGTIRDYGDPDYSIVACELVAFMNQFVWLVVFAWTSKYTNY